MTLTFCLGLFVSLLPKDRSLGEDSDLFLSLHAEEDLSVMTTNIRSPDAAVPNLLQGYFSFYFANVFDEFSAWRAGTTTYESYLFLNQWTDLVYSCWEMPGRVSEAHVQAEKM